ncbi:MAG: hypothetical protein P1U61_02540 [Legionellaceae bacterium]|nr:hypothetical protein [Legionellaceae bacterium]
MFCRLFVLFLLLTNVSIVSADDIFNDKPVRLAIQAAVGSDVIATSFGIGIARYTPKTEIGVTASGHVDNAPLITQTVTPVIFGGLRKALGEHTYFAYGFNYIETFGHAKGLTINMQYEAGAYISLEQLLTNHIMLSGWIMPYQYDHVKIGGITTSNNEVFSAGGIAINYLF